MSASTELARTGTVTVCCELHKPGDALYPAHWLPGGVTGRCCDPADCGPCCPDCPTCPTLQRIEVPRAETD